MCHMSCEHLSALFWHSVSRVWKKKALTKNSGEQIMVIQKKARTIAELISHLLMLSRADQGKAENFIWKK